MTGHLFWKAAILGGLYKGVPMQSNSSAIEIWIEVNFSEWEWEKNFQAKNKLSNVINHKLLHQPVPNTNTERM